MNILKKNPVLSYFIVTFAISWGAILVLIAMNGMPATMAETQAQLPVAIMAYLCGPSIAGLLMVGLADGRAGYRDLLGRLLKWRVGWQWYAVALLTAPLVFIAVHFILMLFSPVYLPGFLGPGGSSLAFLAIMSGIIVGICEEIGWFGFAIPKLRLRYSILTTGLIVGLLWGLWHIMANDIWAIRTYTGDLDPVIYAVLTALSFLIGQLPPFRILMVFIYERTKSLPLMMVMHFSLTACSISFSSQKASGMQVFVYALVMGAAFWLISAVVVMLNRDQFIKGAKDGK